MSLYSTDSHIFMNYLQRVLEARYEKDIKKLTKKCLITLKRKHNKLLIKDMEKVVFKYRVRWEPTIYVETIQKDRT